MNHVNHVILTFVNHMIMTDTSNVTMSHANMWLLKSTWLAPH